MKNKPKRAMLRLFVLLAFSFFSAGLAAQEITITQIDSSKLLAYQTVRLFLNIKGGANPASIADSVVVSESQDGSSYENVTVRSVDAGTNRDEGISFLLLLDNSGSMWDDLEGKPTDNSESTRMAHAKKAIKEFIASVSARDRVGLAVFNTNYTPLAAVSSDSSGIPSALDFITRPQSEDAYTELYGSIESALGTFEEEGRRKALIILSDGENFPFDRAKSTATVQDGLDAANRGGITCYVVNFGNTRDSNIPLIAQGSGGLVFDARNGEELLGIYTAIRSSILDEYTVTYTASMFPGEKRWVKVTWPVSDGFKESTRYYYSMTVLGSNTQKGEWYYLLFVLIPILVYLFFLLFKLEKETTEAGIQLLYGAKNMQTKAFTLTGQKTIIGGSDAADITLTGNPSLKESAATIVFDKSKAQYTVMADSDLTVNNRPVKTRILESGDVINMSGTVVVFDEAVKTSVKKTAVKTAAVKTAVKSAVKTAAAAKKKK